MCLKRTTCWCGCVGTSKCFVNLCVGTGSVYCDCGLGCSSGADTKTKHSRSRRYS